MDKFRWEWTKFAAANLIRRKILDSRPNEQIEKLPKPNFAFCANWSLAGRMLGGNFFHFLFSLSQIMAAALLSFTLVITSSLVTVDDQNLHISQQNLGEHFFINIMHVKFIYVGAGWGGWSGSSINYARTRTQILICFQHMEDLDKCEGCRNYFQK